MKRLIFACFIVVLSVMIFSQVDAADVAGGQVKYQQFCVSCHGATGQGDGPAAAILNPKPRNFKDVAVMSKKTDAELMKVIKEGGPAVGLSASMPPWGSSLSDQDIMNIVAYIRTLAK